MNATVTCEKCGKPLGVFDGALCGDCEKAGQEPKSIIREAIEDYVCNYLTDTAKAQKILNALQNMEQEPVLDKIRAEIETKYGHCDVCEYFEDYDYEENDISEYRPIGDIADILQIIDRHMKGDPE